MTTICSTDILNRLFTKMTDEDRKNFDELLSAYGKEMVLAGGSIANTYLSLIDNKEYPINDIDIYIAKSLKRGTQKTDRGIEIVQLEEVAVDYSSSYFNIYKTTRCGIFNIIYCDIEISQYYSLELFAENLLLSFDLNCVCAGLYFKEQQQTHLLLTDTFKYFVNTRQIEIVSGSARLTTIFRLLKKRDDLNAYLDVEKQYKLFSFFVHAAREKVKEDVLNYAFGDFDRYHTYLKYKDTIDEYFDLELVDQFATIKNLIHKIQFYKLQPKKFKEEFDLVYKLAGNKDNILAYFNHLEGHGVTKAQKEQRLRLLTLQIDSPYYERFLTIFACNNPKYFDCSFRESRVKHFIKYVCKDHSEIASFFANGAWYKKYNLAYQLEIFEHIRQLEKKHGAFCIGLIGNNTEIQKNLITKNWIVVEQLIKEEIEKGNKQIGFQFEINIPGVTLLNSLNLLKEEGTRMHHCVGGYSYYLENFKGLIFHIETDKPSTLRLELIALVPPKTKDNIRPDPIDYKFEVGEHRSAFNQSINDKNKEIEKQIIEYVNSPVIKEEILKQSNSSKNTYRTKVVDLDILPF